jgi:hypothetical protein
VTVGEVVFWAVVYVAGAAAIWWWPRKSSPMKRIRRLARLAMWSGVGALGSFGAGVGCAASNLDADPQGPSYCHSDADFALLVAAAYLALTVVFGFVFLNRRLSFQKRSRAEYVRP